MSNLYLFESGSTKTTVFVCQDLNPSATVEEILKGAKQLDFSGFNPNRPESNFLTEVLTLPIQELDQVYFYGSGLGADESKVKLADYFQENFKVNAIVYDDITGAAKALYHNHSGVLAIMGTGGCVAYFDGINITKRRGGYGYLIDDLGGGYELGKLLVSNWLNNSFNEEINNAIAELLQFSRENFIVNYYSNPNLGTHKEGLKLIASVVEIVAKFQDNNQIDTILNEYFDQFISRHVAPLCLQQGTTEIKAVGSIAHNFEHKIKESASRFGIKLTKVLQYPASELLRMHLTAYLQN